MQKAFAKRFDFDCVELRNLYRNVKNKATADVLKVYYTTKSVFVLGMGTGLV